MDITINRRQVKKSVIKKVFDIANTTISENITKIKKEKDDYILKFLIKSLIVQNFFFNLDDIQLEKVIENMFCCTVKQDQYIFKQDDEASCFFIIQEGEMEVQINGETKKVLKHGDSFGELALLYSCSRSASIKALKPCILWAIHGASFQNELQELTNKSYKDNIKFLSCAKFSSSLSQLQREGVASSLITLRYKANEVIVNEGDPGYSFFIIKSGKVGVYKGNSLIRTLEKNESFGEQALYFASSRTMTCKALETTICCSLGRDQLNKILGDQIKVITFRNNMKWSIEKDPKLAKLTQFQMEKFFNNMQIVNYQKGDVIIKKGQEIKQFMVPMVGNILEGNKVIIPQGSCTSSTFICTPYKLALNDISIDQDGMISEISIEKVKQSIGGELDSILTQNLRRYEKQITFKTQARLDDSISLDNLIKVKNLGAGQFGEVYLVKEKKNSNLFALKCISKKKIFDQKLEKYIKQEKQVMSKVACKNIMQFIRSFKDQHNAYFLIEFIDGQELFDVIREIGSYTKLFSKGLLSTVQSQFYIGSMILALEYLHNQNIVYRDLKPENTIVDSKVKKYIILLIFLQVYT